MVHATDSAVTGNTNSATGPGNAEGVIDDGSNTFIRTSITGNTNSAVTGTAFGGIDTGQVIATNSTISHNTSAGATNEGGGIDDGHPSAPRASAAASAPHGVKTAAAVGTTLVYTTVDGNSSQNGANIITNQTLVAFGTVVAQPAGGGTNCAFVSGATTISNGFNFSDDGSCGFTAATDRQNAGPPGLGDPATTAVRGRPSSRRWAAR